MPLFGPTVVRYEIEIDKPIYFPGDELRGTLYIQCSQEYKCRGVRVHLQGKGHCRFVPSTDNCLVEIRNQYYTNCKRTFFGNVNKTPILKDCGPNAIFGPPWAPDEGVMVIKVPTDSSEVIFRVMDDEWMVKDVVVGEALVNIDEEVGKGIFARPLFFDGKTPAGMLQYRIDWSTEANPDPLHRLLRIQIYKAYNLRKARWSDAKNDVYIQVYVNPSSVPVPPGQPLPNPEMYITLPANTLLTVPFHFQLPYDLPSSFYFNDQNYISYSIYSNVDISWRKDPSTRRFFTVMAYRPKKIPKPLTIQLSRPVYLQLPAPFLCCLNMDIVCLGSYGQFTMLVVTDQAYYVPGDIITLKLQVAATWPEAAQSIIKMDVQLRRRTYLLSDKGYDTRYEDIGEILSFPQYYDAITIPVPSIPPTYDGGLGKNVGWFQQEVAKFGGRWANPPPDPIKWDYFLGFYVYVAAPGCALMRDDPYFYQEIPILICGIQESPFPDEKVNPNLQNPFAKAMQMMNTMMNTMMQGGMQGVMQGGGMNGMAAMNGMVQQLAGMMQQQHQMQHQVNLYNNQNQGMMMMGMQPMNNMNMNPNMNMYMGGTSAMNYAVPSSIPSVVNPQAMMMNQNNTNMNMNNGMNYAYNNNSNNNMNMMNNNMNNNMNTQQNYQNYNANIPTMNVPVNPSISTSNRVVPLHDFNQPATTYTAPPPSVPSIPGVPSVPSDQQKQNNNNNNNASSYNPYGFGHAGDLLAVHEAGEALTDDKQVKPSFADFVLTPSYGKPLVIRDAEEDYTVSDSNLLRYQPVFYTKPPKHAF